MINHQDIDKIIEVSKIEEVVGDFIELKNVELTTLLVVLFIMRKLRLFMLILPKIFSNVSVVERVVIVLIS